ncbi:MAG TPA: carbohydrate ABC transporter permease [Phycisphaerae bacterium]|nr:carbohydrate ABC transporter permease [Phycisphaerae bacterium]
MSLSPHVRHPRRLIGKAFSYLILLALSASFLFPILWSMTASVKPLADVYKFPPELWVRHPQWGNYPEALSKLPFLAFMANTLVIVVSATAGQVLASSLVGYAFARLRFRGRGFWFVVLLATMMLPGQILLIPHFLTFKYLGWVNTYKPLIVPHWLGGGAFFIFLFRQFFKGIPQELEEAARIDGAGDFQIYWRIFLPNARPVLATVAVMAFIGHWKEFMGPLIYLSDFEKYPISLGLHMYNSLEGAWVNLLMAASVVALGPLVIIFFLAQRHFVKGMLLTGTKG